MASIRQALLGQTHSNQEETTRILVPISGNDSDTRLLDFVSKIARKKHSSITMIYVVEVDQSLPLDADLPTEVGKGERVLHLAQNAIGKALDAKTCNVTTDLLQARLAGPAIVDEAETQDADAIIMSANVSKRLGKRTVGETVGYVLKNAPCEVVILRAPMPESILQEMEMDIE